MKIIHITPVYLPYRSGITNVVRNQAQELVRRGHEVVILTALYDKNWSSEEVIEGIKVKRIKPLLKYGNGAFIPRLFGEIKKLASELPSPIIHLHTPFFGGQEVVWLAKKMRVMFGARLIIQYHHDPQLDLLTKFQSLPSKLIFRSLIKSADKVLVSSLDYARHSDLSPLLTKEGIKGRFDLEAGRGGPHPNPLLGKERE